MRAAAQSFLHAQPREDAEAISEVLLGERLEVLERRGEWARVRLQADGYGPGAG